MPLHSKVKTRIQGLACWLLAATCAGVMVAQDSRVRPSVGELAVSPPRQAVITPPLVAKATTANSRIKIDLEAQRLLFLVAGEVAIDTPISSGRKDLETPSGQFLVGKKEVRRKQNAYGNLVNPDGKVIVASVYRHRDPVPSGLRFQAVDLHHVIAIADQKFVIHGGTVAHLPVSEGSIILPPEIAKALFAKVSAGCKIEILGE